MVRRGLAPSREAARELIDSGNVLVGGAPAGRPARLVAAGEPVAVAEASRRFVSRGGQKLHAAIHGFGVDPRGMRCLDAGASTGGFTDCLLQHGAACVVALDVGRGLLHERLRSDARVVAVESTNVRDLSPDAFGGGFFGIVCADLAFISLTKVAGALVRALDPTGGDLIALVKPQFEAGRKEASRGRGVIRDPEVWGNCLQSVAAALGQAGAHVLGAMPSPVKGPAGNVELFVHARVATDEVPTVSAEQLEAMLQGAVTAATQLVSATSHAQPVASRVGTSGRGPEATCETDR